MYLICATLSIGMLFVVSLSLSRCIEWVSLSSFLSVSYPNPSSSGTVRNELLLLDMQTGRTTAMREHKGDETPIEALKVSHMKYVDGLG